MAETHRKTKSPVQYLKIESGFEGQRIDNYLFTRLKGVPKSRIYRILRKGEVRVNKKRIAPSYRIQEGDEVRLPPLHTEERPLNLPPTQQRVEQLKERILYEDKNLLIINKPPGIPVHGGSQVKLGIIEILRTMYPKSPHLELAHRLDADTSGCLVLAKKRSVLREIHELLRSGKVKKIYHTLTKGHWKSSELQVEAPLQKNVLSSGERIVRVDKEGKPSVTHFATLKIFTDASLMSATLLTGRTHQIRVHAQYRGHPIAGDEKYGDKEFNKKMRGLGLKRLFLHAYSVEFILPSLQQHISVVAPLDKDLQNVVIE